MHSRRRRSKRLWRLRRDVPTSLNLGGQVRAERWGPRLLQMRQLQQTKVVPMNKERPALHGLPYSIVASSLIGNYPQNTTQPVLPKKRGADKKGKGTRKTRCLTCVKHDGKNGQWIHLCCGSTARGKCEYFDNAGNRIKPEHEPPAPRGNNKKKQKR